jgi:hypothetical protein
METDTTTELTARAYTHVNEIITVAIDHTFPAKALIIYDTDCGLSEILRDAYQKALPEGQFIDFNTRTKEEIIALFDTLSPGDLVVLIQSMDFRLNDFRVRIQLFQRGLKVVDHQHLTRNTPDSWGTYINALAYDHKWYRGVGRTLKQKLECATTLALEGPDSLLTITGGLEEPKLNIGDYTGMVNIGGTFPIGEVFTEAKDLSMTNGSLMIYAFASPNYYTTMYEPFRVDFADGLVVGWGENTPQAFIDVVTQIKTNERAIIREIGFGLNRAITREKYLNDITAFERILGLHVSLGEKHTVYKKAGITPDKTRFHVDIFPLVDRVLADDVVIFENLKFPFFE